MICFWLLTSTTQNLVSSQWRGPIIQIPLVLRIMQDTMSTTILKEVPLVDFDDCSLNWKVAHEFGGNAEPFVDNAGQECEKLGGCYSYQSPSNNGARMLFWRYYSNSIDILEISAQDELVGGALRLKLPGNLLIAFGGVKWFEKDDELHLCICFTSGLSYVCSFRDHPFAKKDDRKAAPGFSIFNSSNLWLRPPQSAVFKNSLKHCCWFLDPSGLINVASVVDIASAGNYQDSAEPLASYFQFNRHAACEVELTNKPRMSFLAKRKKHSGNVVGLCPICIGSEVYVIGMSDDSVMYAWSISQRSFAKQDLRQENDAVERAFISIIAIEPLRIGVGLNLSSGAASMQVLHGSLSASEMNLVAESNHSVPCSFTLIDVLARNNSLYSLWWKPLSGKSTQILEHTKNGCSFVAYDQDREAMRQRDQIQEYFNPVDFFAARLLVSERYSFDDLRWSFLSSFDDSTSSSKIKGLKPGSNHLIVNLMKNNVTTSCRKYPESERRSMEVLAWSRLLNDCENNWLDSHRPLSLCESPCSLFAGDCVVVRTGRVTGFRANEIIPSLQANSPLNSCLFSLQTRWISELEFIVSHSIRTGASHLIERTHSYIRDSPVLELRKSLEPLNSLSKEHFQKLVENLLDNLAPESSNTISMECTDSSLSPTARRMRLQTQFYWDSLRQCIQYRLGLAVSVLLIVSSLIEGHTKIDNHWSTAPLMKKAAHRCFLFSQLLRLSQESSLEVPRSLDWIRRLTVKTNHVVSSKSLGTASILKVWIESVLNSHSFDNSAALAQLMSLACCLESEVLSFLDREQQYHVLGDVASMISLENHSANCKSSCGYPFFIGESMSKYVAFLQAKSCLWRSLASQGDPGWLDRACMYFRMATPIDGVLDYNFTVMKVFERAKEPKPAMDFALEALKCSANPSTKMSNDDRCVLCAFVFGRALDMSDYKQALNACRMYPSTSDNGNGRYLGQLVSVMIDRGETEALCSLCFESLEEHLWNLIMETLDRKIKESHSIQDHVRTSSVFFAFCVRHCHFVQASQCMFNLSYHIEQSHGDSWTPESLLHYQNALSSSLNALRLASDLASTVSVVFRPPFFQGATKQNQALYQISVSNIEALFVVARALCKLVAVCDDDHRSIILSSRIFSSTSSIRDFRELVLLLVDFRMLDDALTLLLVHWDEEISSEDVRVAFFVHLTLGCEGSKHPASYIQKSLKMLDCAKVPSLDGHKTLRLFKYHGVVLDTILISCVSAEIPQWLQNSFFSWGDFTNSSHSTVHSFARDSSKDEARNPGILIRTLVKFGRIDEACEIASRLMAQMIPASGIYDSGELVCPPLFPVALLDLLLADRGGVYSKSQKILEESIGNYAQWFSSSNVHNVPYILKLK